MKKLTRWEWLLALLLVGPLPAVAADEALKLDSAQLPPPYAAPQHPLLNDTFRFRLGGFYAQTTTEARASTATGGAGADINFEDMLGLPRNKGVLEANMYWRFAERWHVDADYFEINRNGVRDLQKDVTWNGVTYTAGTTVDSKLDMSDLRTAVGYSFFRRPDKEIGMGLGLHVTSFSASLNASGIGATNQSATAPLPFVTVYANFALTDTWAMSVRADWLSLTYDKYSGGIRSTAVDFIYQPFTHFAFGFGIHSLSLRLQVDNPDSQLQARIVAQGPAAFMSVSF